VNLFLTNFVINIIVINVHLMQHRNTENTKSTEKLS